MVITRWTVLACAALVLSACPPGQKKATKEEKQVMSSPGAAMVGEENRAKVVAKVGSSSITVGQVTDELNEQNPYIRMRYTSLEQKKKFLHHLIQFEVLYQEAARRKLETDPEVIRKVKREMVNQLMVRMRDELVKIEDITDADVKAFYDKNNSMYKQPHRVRVSQVVCETKQTADKVLKKIQAKPKDARYFAELVNTYSVDPATKVRRGDLGFFAKDEVTKKAPKAVNEAAFAIKELFGVGGPVKTEAGWVVLMKTGDREASHKTLDSEKEQIRNRLYNERRHEAIEAYVKKLETEAKVHVDDKALATVKPKMKPLPPPAAGHKH